MHTHAHTVRTHQGYDTHLYPGFRRSTWSAVYNTTHNHGLVLLTLSVAQTSDAFSRARINQLCPKGDYQAAWGRKDSKLTSFRVTVTSIVFLYATNPVPEYEYLQHHTSKHRYAAYYAAAWQRHHSPHECIDTVVPL